MCCNLAQRNAIIPPTPTGIRDEQCTMTELVEVTASLHPATNGAQQPDNRANDAFRWRIPCYHCLRYPNVRRGNVNVILNGVSGASGFADHSCWSRREHAQP